MTRWRVGRVLIGATIGLASTAASCGTESRQDVPVVATPPTEASSEWPTVRVVEAKPCEGFARAEMQVRDLKLARSDAFEWMHPSAPIIVSKVAVFLDGEPLVKIQDGRIPESELDAGGIPSLRAPLTAWAERLRAVVCEQPRVAELTVFADARVEASAVIQVLDTASRFDFQAFAIAVDADVGADPFSPVLTVFRAPYHRAAAVELREPHVKAVIDDKGVTIWDKSDDAERIPFAPDRSAALAAIESVATRRAASMTLNEVEFPTVVFAIEGHATVADMVDVLSAFAGKRCSQRLSFETDYASCKMPFRIFDPDLTSLPVPVTP